MAQYVELQQSEIQAIAVDYGLALRSFAPLPGGHNNTSFRLRTTPADYVLTVFDNKSAAEVFHLAQLMLLLEQHEFPTARLLQTSSGELTATLQGKPVIVKPFVAGRVIDPLTPEMVEQAGVALARLHQISAPPYLPQENAYNWRHFPEVIGLKLDPPYESWLAARQELFRRRLPHNLPQGLIHGDLFADNLLFEQQTLKAMLDFEDVCRFTLCFDLGMALVGLCRRDGQLAVDEARAFLGGYQQIRELQQEERVALQLHVDYAATVTSYWRFWKYRVRYPSPTTVQKHWKMAHFADHVSALPENLIFELSY